MAEEQKQEFWRWPESNWKNPELDWSRSKFIAVGIDVGSVSSQAVIVADGQILAYGNMRTGFDSPNSARNAYKFALNAIGMPEERMNYCIGTGYGRVNVPFANRTLTEIACHARGRPSSMDPTWAPCWMSAGRTSNASSATKRVRSPTSL